ncbi:MAG: AbrB/MazE/SpoVT family DNA-binding domain-containing protein [Gammaproteobacteria bacterium]|nr:AbrB/MazE/SpoVT family DNA-binding domain-containing protein [Gammaproteobacteria bacterium]
MRVSERGQVTIPKTLRDQFGMNHNVEVEMIPTKRGLLIQKRTTTAHPVERIYGVLGGGGNTDDLIEEIRGR